MLEFMVFLCHNEPAIAKWQIQPRPNKAKGGWL